MRRIRNQAWGNSPEAFTDLLPDIQACLRSPGGEVHDDTVATLLRFQGWDYAWMTEPPLIVLDTRTGDRAQAIYASLGYQTVGAVPDFAIDPDKTAFHSTTYMYRALYRAL